MVGALAGYGIRRLTVWLCRLEELEYGSEAWQVWGPPVVCALLFAVGVATAFGHFVLTILKGDMGDEKTA